MTLIKSISGIRGTIGGAQGTGLTPPDVVKFTAGYGFFIQKRNPGRKVRVVVGRDARISGFMVNQLVTATLTGMGIDVTDLGLSTTPTVEVAVTELEAQGGIIITASPDPANLGTYVVRERESQGHVVDRTLHCERVSADTD